MKKHKILLLTIMFGFIGYKNREQSKNQKNIKPQTKKVEKKISPSFSEKDYSLLFQYSQGEDNQLIRINFKDKKTIEFYLITKTLPCDTEFWGIAKDKYSDIASEVDEDENGTAYGTIEYIKNESEYTIAIRMALDSSKVQINYIEENDLGTDCLPITERIMKRIK